jgi:hypothetical protein
MMLRQMLAEHSRVPVGPEKGRGSAWAVRGKGQVQVVTVVFISVGNMIEPGQPQRRQLICRRRLAPRSELCQTLINDGQPVPLEKPGVGFFVSCAIVTPIMLALEVSQGSNNLRDGWTAVQLWFGCLEVR